MYSLIVNGKAIETTHDKKLMAFLRDDLRLTSVKEGCGEGACGTCMVIVDGKATRACLPTVAKSAGKNVVTVEGLSAREKEVYAYAFGISGAVQCGFCIPGMVISAKALLDVTSAPSREQVKKAIRGNICRCTGYVKIEEAILLAANMLREDTPIPQHNFTGKLGENFIRLDAASKTLGAGLYADDLMLDGMVYAKALRSKYPRARVVRIDTSKAAAHPQAVRIITAADIPGKNKIGHIIYDWDTLIPEGDVTRYVGDAIALAVVRDQCALDEVLSLIEVEWEELTPMVTPQQALAEGAPKIHQSGNILKHEALRRGDVDTAIANAAYVVTRHYSVPFTEHACMEPECAVALPDGDDGILLYSGGQGIYDEQRECSEVIGISPDKVHVKSMLVGGGFGGKEDMSVQHHAVLAAWLTKLPVKVKFSRQESIMIHPKRHAMEIDMTTACDENGKLVGMKAIIISDTGAYASLGGPVLQRACTHAGGPYNYPNLFVDGKAVYTNNVPGGAFRGFGVTQSCFAMECNMNLLAEKVGISPWEIRFRNAVRPGDVLPNGQIADPSTSLEKCLLVVKDVYEQAEYAGIACAFKNAGLGVGVPDIGRCIVSVEQGKVHIRTSAACIGQGMATVNLQMACETLNLAPELFVIENPDTKRTPNTGTTTASRQTVFTGEAVVLASKMLKAELDGGKTLAELEGKEFYAEFFPKTDPMGSDKPNPISHVAYGFATQVVTLDKEGRVTGVTAAYDCGKLVNPGAATGQVEGGVVMGLGYALTEDYPLENGYPQAKFGTLGLWRATEVPPIHVTVVENDDYNQAAHGAKGIGELATIPTAPAVQGAYYKLDGVFRQKLPMEDTFYRKAK